MPTLSVSALDRKGRAFQKGDVVVDGAATSTPLGGAPIRVDPGTHRVSVRIEGKAMTAEITVRSGQAEVPVTVRFADLEVKPAPLPSPAPDEPPPVGFWVFGSIGLAALTAAGALTISGHVERADLESCRPDCPDERRDSIELQWYTAAGLAGGGVLALTAAGIWYAAASGTDTTGPVAIKVVPLGAGGAVTFGGRW
jgi:hypothetical protein